MFSYPCQHMQKKSRLQLLSTGNALGTFEGRWWEQEDKSAPLAVQTWNAEVEVMNLCYCKQGRALEDELLT